MPITNDIMTNPQYIQELTKKIRQYANPEQIPIKPAEEILPSTNFMEQIGQRPLMTAAPMDLEFKASASPMSALGVGIGKALQHLYNIKTLNEQQSIKDYEGKLKMAQEKDLRRAEAQEKLRYQQAVEQLPSEQQKKDLTNVQAMLALGREKREAEQQPLEDEMKRAQIARAYQSMSGEKKATSVAAMEDAQMNAFVTEVLTNDAYKDIRNTPNLLPADIFTLSYAKMMKENPRQAAKYTIALKKYGSKQTQEQQLNRAEQMASKTAQGGIIGSVEAGKRIQSQQQNQPQPQLPAQIPQGKGMTAEDANLILELLKGGK